MTSLFALVDCNSFYASCERVFRPDLRAKPIVVLSNNDGCIIARSAEAKALGISMGAPYFKCRDMLRRNGVAVFSSNYALYGDLSSRVMNVLERFSPRLEVYSIDEAFLDLSNVPGGGAHHARRLRATVLRWTGIPVSVGLGRTRTLAKIANRFAKQQPQCRGVFNLECSPKPELVLSFMPVRDVWGIGRRHARRLEAHGVHSALDFRDLDSNWVKRRMGVTGLHTQLELRGISCFGWDHRPGVRKSVLSSRSFGRPVERVAELREAVAYHTERAAEKLRRQKSVASGVTVFLETNRFAPGAPQYSNSGFTAIHPASLHTPILLGAALSLLDRLFREGYQFKKCGVMFSGLEQERGRWLSLFDTPDEVHSGHAQLMQTLDGINGRWGRDTVHFAASGLQRTWTMRQEMRSPRYTSVWSELPVAKAE